MDEKPVRTFLAVLDHRSLTDAAEALGLAQSTVSFRLDALERELGAKVLDRRGGGVRPTAAGRAFLPFARRLVALVADARARLAAEERAERGQVTVCASTVPAAWILPAILARFRAEHPGVAVSVEVADSRAATVALFAEQCDFAVIGAPLHDRRAATAPCGEDEIVLVASPELVRAAGGKAGPNPAESLPLILREEGSGTGAAVARLLARRPTNGAGAPAPIRVGSTEAVRQCVLEGLGASFLSRLSVAGDLAAGRMIRVPQSGAPVRRRFHAVRVRGATLSRPAAALWRALVQHER